MSRNVVASWEVSSQLDKKNENLYQFQLQFPSNVQEGLNCAQDQSLTSIIVSLILSPQFHLLCHQMSTGWWTYWCILGLWNTHTIGTALSTKI